MGYIYKITNVINEKVYIGQTSKTIQERFAAHISKAKQKVNRYLYDAMNHYGYENFIIEEIEECSNDKLDEREIYWINFYQSTLKEKGYNMTIGGGGGDTWTNNPHKEETLQKIRETKIVNGTWGKAIPKGTPNPRKGIPFKEVNKDEFLQDIQNGMYVEELIEKYGVSRRTIITRCQQLYGKTLSELRTEQFVTKPRVNKGFSQARSEALKGDKNPRYKNLDKDKLKEMIETNVKAEEICKYFNISKPTLYKKVKEYFNKSLKEMRK